MFLKAFWGLLNFDLYPIIFIAITFLLYYLTKNDNQKYNARQPPFIPSKLPFFGHMFTFGPNPIKFLADAYKDYGPIFSFTMLGKRFVYLCDSQAISFFFNSKNEHLNAEEIYSRLVTPVFGTGVVYDVPHNIFMEQKKMIKNGLIQARYRTHVPIIEQETYEFLHKMIFDTTKSKRELTINVLEKMSELIIFTSSACLMGKEVRAALTEEVAQWYSDLDGGFCIEAWLFPKWIPFPAFKKRDQAHQKIKELFLRIIGKRRRQELQNQDQQGDHTSHTLKTKADPDVQSYENNFDPSGDTECEEGGDMITTFMNSRYKSGRYTSDDEVAKLMISLLMAGQHTSSTTSSWLLLFLAKHQDVQERVYNEIREHCMISTTDQGFKKVDLDLDTLKKLELLDYCLKETLRLRPPLLTLMRLCKKDVGLRVKTKNGAYKSYVIPKGFQVCVSPTFTHQLETYWPDDSGNFNPDRYLNDKSITSDELPSNQYNVNLNATDNPGDDRVPSPTQPTTKLSNSSENITPKASCPFGYDMFKTWFATTSLPIHQDDSTEPDASASAFEESKKFHYFPFGAGRHRCVGEAFAYVQIKTIVASILANFRVYLVNDPLDDGSQNSCSDTCDNTKGAVDCKTPKVHVLEDDNVDPHLLINYRTLISTPLKPLIRLERRGDY